MKTFLSAILLAALSELATTLIRQHIHKEQNMEWLKAQQYCRMHYDDLSTISSEEEYARFMNTVGNLSHGWIGLYKAKEEMYSQWSDGNPVTYTWQKEYLITKVDQTDQCVSMSNGVGDFLNCKEKQMFFCYKVPDLILVEENKTWEEALEYCRVNYADLASLTSESDLLTAKNMFSASTVRVWTGLRFLAGSWFWVNRETLDGQISLPSCPVYPERCGARNLHADLWEFRDCEEKLSSLCYSGVRKK